jgi:hypothetical protein
MSFRLKPLDSLLSQHRKELNYRRMQTIVNVLGALSRIPRPVMRDFVSCSMCWVFDIRRTQLRRP